MTKPGLRKARPQGAPLELRIGKDILELVSTAMYVDPLTLYREYLQNAADAVDVARQTGLLAVDEPGRVEVALDPDPRRRAIRIRDNGTGLSSAHFLPTLLSLGGSAKRDRNARGFRGVGRFAGLGYARELIFRSRAAGEGEVLQLSWDGLALRAALRDPGCASLDALVERIVLFERLEGKGYPDRFFEVELKGVARLGHDRLMSAPAVRDYLSQVAPVPFAPDFAGGAVIREALARQGVAPSLDIQVSGLGTVYRPHRDSLDLGDGRVVSFAAPRIVELPAHDEGLAGLVWILDHEYEGALPVGSLIKGLRARVGDLQVGETGLFEELFAEPRFNGWTVGEVHVFDRRIVPNGRRDQFEPSVHLANLENQLGPVAKDVSQSCRTRSIRRKWLRDAEAHRRIADEKLQVLAQGTQSEGAQRRVVEEVEALAMRLEKAATVRVIESEDAVKIASMAKGVRDRLAEVGASTPTPLLERLPEPERSQYVRFFELIYACSVNRVAAKSLVDRILEMLTEAEEPSRPPKSAGREAPRTRTTARPASGKVAADASSHSETPPDSAHVGRSAAGRRKASARSDG